MVNREEVDVEGFPYEVRCDRVDGCLINWVELLCWSALPEAPNCLFYAAGSRSMLEISEHKLLPMQSGLWIRQEVNGRTTRPFVQGMQLNTLL
jgi:hypothetical protein